MIVTVDGGPDENPRYKKTIDCAIDYFNSFDLDALFIATNAPGCSAFNRCERRMTPLSKEVAGLILGHQHFGTHLNFEYAGSVLAEIWLAMVFDDHPTVAEYISVEADSEIRIETAEWKSKHVRQSQYCLQIVKCEDILCCLPFRSRSLERSIFTTTSPVAQTKDGLRWVADDKGATYLTLYQNLSMKDDLTPSSALRKYPRGVPYDYSNPAVKEETIRKRICKSCRLYLGAINAKESHQRDMSTC